MGQVLQAGAGQAPARQAALGAGLPESVACSTVNKVCASGMKAIMLGAQSIQTGANQLVVAGGMESMSQVPRYLKRAGQLYGNLDLADGILLDGLTDAYDKFHMGICAENTCKQHGISRQHQDDYAVSSYNRSIAAHQSGLLAREIVPVQVTNKGATVQVNHDEEFTKVHLDRIPKLKPAFDSESGTVTAANASTLNDGAAATVLASPRAVQELKLEPLAELIAYADAACKPIDFPLAPALSIPKVSPSFPQCTQAVEYGAPTPSRVRQNDRPWESKSCQLGFSSCKVKLNQPWQDGKRSQHLYDGQCSLLLLRLFASMN